MGKIISLKRYIKNCSALLFWIIAIFVFGLKSNNVYALENVLIDRGNTDEQVLYLTDIPYSKAQVGWGTIAIDKTQDNKPLILVLNGYSTVFNKGIWAHATSTVEYDISEYKDYDYFTTYYGLNTTAGSTGNGVKFYIYTSKDGKDWTLQTEENPTAQKGTNNATYAKIDIRDVNYIKLYAHDNGSNASDHAVWADPKLVKEDYNDNATITVEEFDAIIKNQYTSGIIQDDLKLTLLQRDLIYRVGQYQLRTFIDSDPKNKETLEWFLYDEEALRLWTIGGSPNGTYGNALQVLSNLYHAYKDDLQNENVTQYGTKYKDLYLRMMLSLSLTHSANVGLWIGGNQLSNALVRYEIYKQMHLDNKLESNAMFENYTIEEMRGVMLTNIDDEEILWLHDYSQKKFPNRVDRFNPYKYINYTLNYSYYRPQYYSQENYAKWDQKYELSKYNITYQSGKPKLWIVFEEGAVCGGLSKTAANLYGVWGYPARVVGQPGHAAYTYLYNAGGGNYAWQLAYSVATTAWANTDGGGRMPNGWGNRYATSNGSIKPGSYLLLSQQAQNEYDKYESSEFILLLENVYKDDRKKLEQIYRDALNEEIINLDAWIGLVNLYITDNTKTDAELINLAEEIAGVMTYHPLPMYDLTRRIGTKITSLEYRSKLMMIQEQTLNKATKATSTNTIYHKEVPVIAQAILGQVDSKIASFSFSGGDAGKIILSKQLQSAQVNWSYSLDGGKTWTDCYEHFVQLTDEQVKSININDDIKVHISGLPMTNDNIYTIDITKRSFPGGITINDEENFMLGTTNEMEWTFDLKAGWNSFANSTPTLTGDKVIYVRVIASGTQIASDPVHYTFTENNSDDTKWYIQSKNLKIVDVNATWTGDYNNILDGNINTYWRSKNGMMPAYVTIQLNEPRYISGLDYIPDKNAKYITFVPYGRARNVNIYVSMDGQNWELAAGKNNLGDNDSLKHIEFPTPKKALYVKFESSSVYDSEYTCLAISVIKLYENVLVNEVPRAEVSYNVKQPTNQNVVASLVNLTRPITVTNNDGKDTYTFTENGDFTFEFIDEFGNIGSTTAHVDWIDKTPPTLEVEFSTTEITNENVVATLIFDKPVTILSTDVQVAENPVDKSKTITFLENATYELKFKDNLGNIGTKTIMVDWIDQTDPTAEIEYSTIHLTDKEVTAKLSPSEPVTITNNDGKDTYTFKDNGTFTFEFVDRAGNEGTATATVTWIAKVPKYEITYSKETPTNQAVDVTLTLENGYRIINNDAKNVYTFTENGDFNFEYVDQKGNVGSIKVSVDWIDKEVPTAEFEYSTKHLTDKTVTVKLVPSEPVDVINNDGKNTYTFNKNGSFMFEFVDKAGNKGIAIATVTWIGNLPKYQIKYSKETPTNQNVVATLELENGYKIINNNSSNVYTFTDNGTFDFEYMDSKGDIGFIPVIVNWIDRKAPTAQLKYVKEKNKVIVSVVNPSEEITFKEGKGIYEFTENGTYDIIFYDKAGNEGKLIATIDFIKEEVDDRPDQPNIDKPIVNPPSMPNKAESILDSNNTSNIESIIKSEYKKYATENINVEIPSSAIVGDGILKIGSFEIPNELKEKFGELSEIYDLYLENNQSERISINSNEPIKIYIKLKGTKELEGVYEIMDDNTIKPVTYIKNGENIELTTNSLGRYVVNYKEEKKEQANTEVKDLDNTESEPSVLVKKKNPYIIIGVISGAVVALGISVSAIKKRHHR